MISFAFYEKVCFILCVLNVFWRSAKFIIIIITVHLSLWNQTKMWGEQAPQSRRRKVIWVYLIQLVQMSQKHTDVLMNSWYSFIVSPRQQKMKVPRLQRSFPGSFMQTYSTSVFIFVPVHDGHNQISEHTEDLGVPHTDFSWVDVSILYPTLPSHEWTSDCVCLSKLTVGTGSLQVRYDSENVIHQVGSLFVLQYAARGGVGRVYIRQIGQVHPWNKARDRKRCITSNQEKHTALLPHAVSI